MGAFEYSALNLKGRESKGILEGDSERHIRQQLMEKKLTPLRVEAVAQREHKRSGAKSFSRGVGVAPLALMTRQVATLIRAGTPLTESIGTIAKQTDHSRLKSVLLAVRAQILEGHSYADGLAQFPQVFDSLYIATVRAGEKSGHLDVIMERLANYTESRQTMRQKVQLALLYPVILTLMAFTVVGFLLAFVVPKLVTVFDNTGQELPMLTTVLIKSSEFLNLYYPYLLVFIVAFVLGFLRLMKRDEFRLRVHQILLKLPVVGTLVRGMNTSRLARTLSILSASSVPLLEALRISAQVLGNLPMRYTVERATERVREGSSLAQSLEAGGYFPPLIIQLISSGEATGELEQMLDHAAENQERELQTTIATVFGILEPVLILAMGGIVLVIVLAIMLPILELNQLVQ